MSRAMDEPNSALVSEDQILALIERHFPRAHPQLLKSRGDDCALLAPQGPLCVSSDLFLEDVHFRRSYFLAAEVGHKALAVNLSDLAACGGKPLAFSLCLGLAPWLTLPWLELFFQGMAALANAHNLALLGGDLSRSDKLHISITIFGTNGKAPGSNPFLARRGVAPGDCLFVLGEMGLARAGLQALEKSGRSALASWPKLCAAHFCPQPLVREGLRLAALAAKSGIRLALMDLSDGLMADLPRLLKKDTGNLSGLCEWGAELTLSKKDLQPELLRHAETEGQNALHEAMLGGEDYALLGGCAPQAFGILADNFPDIRCIGHVSTKPGIRLNGEDLTFLHGFDHFFQASTIKGKV